MNRQRAKELLPIIQAFADGKDVQVRMADRWTPLGENIGLYAGNEYRIKPKPREWWVNVYARQLPYVHSTKEAADNKLCDGGETIKVREALDDD